jgi:predicted negative regulator of RcsB-dependent stress response
VKSVSVYDSDDEQVEALKKWWNENGRSIVVGAVLGLGAVFGWQAWTQHQEQVASQASLRYEKMSQAIQAGNVESVLKQGEKIITEWPESSYAVFASLDMAKIQLGQGDSTAAKKQYEWVLANSGDASLKQMARLRLARILLSENSIDKAEAVAAKADKDSYNGEFAALRGDIARAKQDYAAARNAYLEALNGDVGNRRMIQMKLDDLAKAEADK